MAKFKSVKFKAKSSLFKTFGLLALIFFTFYFIYNYLATGSFSLKPRASEVVTNEVNSCGSLKTDVDCNKFKDRGCSWVVGPSTTKTEMVPVTKLVPKTTTTEMNCEEEDCAKGNYGCRYTNTTKTTYQTQKVYECDDGSGVSQSKCIQLGGAWVYSGTTKQVPVTTTVKNCGGSYEKTYTIQETVTDYVTKVTEVPGVGSCVMGKCDSGLDCFSGELIDRSDSRIFRCLSNSREVNCCPSGLVFAEGHTRCVDSTTVGTGKVAKPNAVVLPTPKSTPGTCSAGMTKCSTTYTKDDSVDICVGNGKWQLKNFCAGAKCTNGKCDIKAFIVTPKIQFGVNEPDYPDGRSMNCTYKYTKAFDLLSVTNPDTKKKVFINSFSKRQGDEYGNGTPCSNKDLGRTNIKDMNNDSHLDAIKCIPLNINGCGNIGFWLVNYSYSKSSNNPFRYDENKQYFQCSDSSQCEKEFGKYYTCNDNLRRCALNLAKQACSEIKNKNTCLSTYYYDGYKAKTFCEWDGSVCRGLIGYD